MGIDFKNYFLLTEANKYFSSKLNSVLEDLQDILTNDEQMGVRDLMDRSENVVNQIRKILHTSWDKKDYKYLLTLQKCGVAIMKAIDEKGDLSETLNSCKVEVEKIMKKIGNTVNKI